MLSDNTLMLRRTSCREPEMARCLGGRDLNGRDGRSRGDEMAVRSGGRLSAGGRATPHRQTSRAAGFATRRRGRTGCYECAPRRIRSARSPSRGRSRHRWCTARGRKQTEPLRPEGPALVGFAAAKQERAGDDRDLHTAAVVRTAGSRQCTIQVRRRRRFRSVPLRLFAPRLNHGSSLRR